MSNSDTDDEGGTRPTSGKFSQLESDYIVNSVHKYVHDNNFNLSEIIDGIREGNRMESGRLHYLWQQLAREMPSRSAKAIYQHAHRRLLKDVITPWNDDEKAQLVLLVEQKGKNWSAISKVLNKLGDDCKHMYARCLGRKRSGKFSPHEDVDLIQAIQQEMNLPLDMPLCDYPNKGIRWVNVAKRLGDDRHNLDYLRRWATIKSKCGDGQKTLLTEQQYIENFSIDVLGRAKRHRVSTQENTIRINLMLDYLSDPTRGFSHESQVKFAEIDRIYSFPYGYSSHKFKGMSSDCPRFSHFQEQVAWIREKFCAKEQMDASSFHQETV